MVPQKKSASVVAGLTPPDELMVGKAIVLGGLLLFEHMGLALPAKLKHLLAAIARTSTEQILEELRHGIRASEAVQTSATDHLKEWMVALNTSLPELAYLDMALARATGLAYTLRDYVMPLLEMGGLLPQTPQDWSAQLLRARMIFAAYDVS